MRGRRTWTWLLVLSLVLSLFTPAFANERAGSGNLPFYDVYGTPHQQAVEWLYPLGVVRGVSDTEFGGAQLVNRAQMAAFAVRALRLDVSNAPGISAFKDVAASHWANPVIQQANSSGIVLGDPNGYFHPDKEVTLAEAVTMLIRALGYDKEISGTWPVAHMLKAKELGLLAGIENFELSRNATRSEVAILLSNTIFRVPFYGAHGQTLSQLRFRAATTMQIAPVVDYLTKGSTPLTAEGVDFAGKAFTVPGSFRVVSGEAVISSDAVLHITGGDAVTVSVESNGKTAFRTYTVVDKLVITPENTGVEVRKSAKLEATGVTTSGKRVTVTPSWSVTSGPGTVDSAGNVTASGAGTIMVSAKYGSLEASTAVLAGVSVAVKPESVMLTPGSTQKFAVEAPGATGALAPTWKVIGAGSISTDGLFTAGNDKATVEVSFGSLKATAAVTVIKELSIAPKEVKLARAASVSLMASAKTSTGDSISVTPEWSVTNQLGIVGSNGALVATKSGTGEIIAKYGSLTTRIPLTVVGEAVGLRISASKPSVPANGNSTITLKAWAVDAGGNRVSNAVSKVQFSMTNGTVGSLSAVEANVVDGVAEVTFTPSRQAGQTTIYVAAGESVALAGSAMTISTYPPVPAKVELLAYPSSMAADGVSTTSITARLVDSDGAEIVNNTGNSITVNLASSNAAIGSLTSNILVIPVSASSASTTFRANTALGTSRITGYSVYQVVDTTVNAVLVGAAAKLHINRNITATKADGATDMVVKVELQDANGNVRTGDYNVPIYLDYAPTGIQPVLTTGSVAGGVATFRIRSTTAGEHRLRAYALSSGIRGDEATATFTPGNPAKLVLSVDPSGIVPADRVSTVDLVATVKDVHNNLVPVSGTAVTFERITSVNAVTLPANRVVYTVDGVARIAVTGQAYPGTDTFTASAPGLTTIGATGANIDVTSKILGVPTRVDIQPVPSARVGETATVKVYLKDSLGNVISNASGRTVSLQASSATAVVSAPTQSVHGVATFTVTTTRAEGFILTASSPGLESDLNEPVSFSPGAPSKIILRSNFDALTADGISQTTLWADLVDSYGNVITQGQRIQLSLSGSMSGRLTSDILYTGGSNTVFVATTTPGTVTVSGAAAYPVEPVTIRTAVAGLPARVRVETPASVPAGVANASRMMVRVRIEDAQGNIVTSLNSGSELTAVGLTVQGRTGESTITINGSDGLPTYAFNVDGVTTGSSRVTNGTATFYFTNKRAETVSFVPVVYYRGAALPSVSAQGTTVAGAAHHIELTPVPLVFNAAQAGSRVTVRAAVADLYGNVIPTAGDTLRFSLDNTSVATIIGDAAVRTDNGVATVVLEGKQSRGSKARLTVTSDRSGVAVQTVDAVADILPEPPTVWATDHSGLDYTVSSSDSGAKVVITAPVRELDQTVVVQVDGVIVPVYTENYTDAADTRIPAGTNRVITVYIRKQDLGWFGTKQIRATITTALGISPLSTPAQIIYSNQ